MKKLFTILAASAALVLSGCNEIIKITDPGDPVTKVVETVGNYTALDISNAFDVYVDKNATAVTVTAGENVMPFVIVEEVDGTLKIYIKRFTTIRSGSLKAIVPYSTALKDVILSGASSFHSDYPLVDEKVSVSASGASSFMASVEALFAEIDCSGASSFKGNVMTSQLDLNLSGASSADIVGVTEILRLELSGASKNIQNILAGCYCLACRRCEGSISGASRAYIHCDKAVEVSVSGASSLHYTGDASTSGSSTSGASNIVHDRL